MTGTVMLGACITLTLISCEKEQQVSTDTPASMMAQNMPTGCEASIPEILEVPAGNKLAYRVYATGSQIYQVRRSATNPNEFVWVNTAPTADLFIQPSFNNLVGTHYGGPTWEFIQGPYAGEKTVAAKLQGVTVDATAIPWLLLKTVDAQSSAGNKVTYIQRVCTSGGLAPSIIPNEGNIGQVEYVPYTATYLFFEKK